MAYKRTRRRNPADVRAGIKAENVSVYKKPKAKKKSSPKKKSPLAGTPFDPKTPFGKQLPKEAQKAPGSPKVPVPISVPGQKQSFPTSIPTSRGGGGSRQGPTAPLGGTAFDPNQAFGAEIPTSIPDQPTQPPQFGAGVGFDSPILRGFSQDATTMEKLQAGLDVAGGGFATKGGQLTNKFVRQVWKQKAAQKVLNNLEASTAKYLSKEGYEELVQFALREMGEELGEKGAQQVGRAAVNSKTAKISINYLKELAKVARSPKAVFYMALAAITTAVGTASFSKVMNPNVKGDVPFPYMQALSAAVDADDLEEAQRIRDALNDSGKVIESYDGVLGDYSPWKYGKGEYKKFDGNIESADSIVKSLETRLKNEAEEAAEREARDLMFAEQKEAERQHDLEMSQLMDDYLSKKIAAEEANDLRDARNWDRKIRKEQKEWDRRQKEIAERDELLRQQRLAEFDAKMKEFNRQQKIFMENWAKRQKFYQEQRGSNLGFGLFR